jgi:putative ABC transport system substrate-binding protein
MAQVSKPVRRVGVLSLGQRPTEVAQEVLARLRELGWIEGRNLAIESRVANWEVDRLRPLADELVRLGVDMIVASGTPAALAAKNATTSIPIVMTGVGDPVGTGLVASLARPGGNITGYSVVARELAAKRCEVVHELLPAAQRVAVFASPKGLNSLPDLLREVIAAAYRSLGVQTIFIEVDPGSSELDRALVDGVREAVRQQAQALELWGGDAAGAAVKVALGYRLPVIAEGRELLETGGLLYFDADHKDRSRRVAGIIDKILRGAKPADIPIEQPTRYEIVINLKTAKALGITVPRSLLLRADEVIQ